MKKVGVLGFSALGLMTLGACAAEPAGETTGSGNSAIITPTYCRMECPATAGGASEGRVTTVKWNGTKFLTGKEAIINGDTSVADFGAVSATEDYKAALVLRGIVSATDTQETRTSRVALLKTALNAHRSGCAGWNVSSFGNATDGNEIFGFTCKDDIPNAHCKEGDASSPTSLACPAATTARDWCIALQPIDVYNASGSPVTSATCGANYRVNVNPAQTTAPLKKYNQATNSFPEISPKAYGMQVIVADGNTADRGVEATVFANPGDLTCFNSQSSSLQTWLSAMNSELSTSCHSGGISLGAVPEGPTKTAAMAGAAYANDHFSSAYLNQRTGEFEFWGVASVAGNYRCTANLAKGKTACVFPEDCSYKALPAGGHFWCALYAPGASFLIDIQ